MKLFVDSSVWFAAVNEADGDFARAKEILRPEEQCVTTDHVLIETWLLLNSRVGQYVAERFFRQIRNGVAEVVLIKAKDIETAWSIGQQFPDQNFSIVDRTSFAVMERLRLRRVASFDNDFVVYRYGPRREHAFAVVR